MSTRQARRVAAVRKSSPGIRPLPPKSADLAGQEHNHWTFIRYAGSNAQRAPLWVIRCKCGTEKTAAPYAVLVGRSKSCGCEKANAIRAKNTRHGLRCHELYNTWQGMISRCTRAYTESYPRYGGRGITVCPQWLGGIAGFKQFLRDVPARPAPGYKLDRINNSGNYEPGNVQWLTSKENSRNKDNNRMVTVHGKTQCVTAWAEELGILAGLLYQRLDMGWTDEEAVSTPSRNR